MVHKKIILFILLFASPVHWLFCETNLLAGDFPGFEQTTATVFSPGKWNASSSSISSSTSLKRNGSRSARFSNPTSSYSGRTISSPTNAILPNEIYRFGGWFWVTNEGGGIENTDIRFRIVWLDDADHPISSFPGTTGLSLSTFNSWQELSFTNTSPANAVKGYLLIEVKESVNNNNDVFFDDAYLIGHETEPKEDIAYTRFDIRATQVTQGQTNIPVFAFSLSSPSNGAVLSNFKIKNAGTLSPEDIISLRLSYDNNSNKLFDSGDTFLTTLYYTNEGWSSKLSASIETDKETGKRFVVTMDLGAHGVTNKTFRGYVESHSLLITNSTNGITTKGYYLPETSITNHSDIILSAPTLLPEGFLLKEHFDGSMGFPFGWSTNNQLERTNARFASAPYSIRFNANGDELITPLVANASLLSYKVRASSGVSAFLVEYSTNEGISWAPLTGSPTEVNYEDTFIEEAFDLTDYTSPLQFKFRRMNAKTYYLDDVFVQKEIVRFKPALIDKQIVSSGDSNVTVSSFALQSTANGARLRSLTLSNGGSLSSRDIASMELYLDHNHNLRVDSTDSLLGHFSIGSVYTFKDINSKLALNGVETYFVIGMSFKPDAELDQGTFLSSFNPSSIWVSNEKSSKTFNVPADLFQHPEPIILSVDLFVETQSSGVIYDTVIDESVSEVMIEDLTAGSLVEVLTSSGRLVSSLYAQSPRVKWVVPPKLSSGVYFIKIDDGMNQFKWLKVISIR